MFAHVVVAHDGSGPAELALQTAVDLTLRLGGRLTVAHVAWPPLEEPLDRGEAIGLELLGVPQHVAWTKRMVTTLAPLRHALDAEPYVVIGTRPADELLRVADELEAALLVTGTRGRRRWQPSVSRRLVAKARCPVLVVGAAVRAGARPARAGWRTASARAGVATG